MQIMILQKFFTKPSKNNTGKSEKILRTNPKNRGVKKKKPTNVEYTNVFRLAELMVPTSLELATPTLSKALGQIKLIQLS